MRLDVLARRRFRRIFQIGPGPVRSGHPAANTLVNWYRYRFGIEDIMQLSGYANTELSIEEVVPAELAEVTMCATPAELRRMAEFFLFCASEMDRMGQTYDHIHLADRMKEFEGAPHFVVFRSAL